MSCSPCVSHFQGQHTKGVAEGTVAFILWCLPQVLEDEEAVWVDGGVMTIAFLDYLAHYTTESAPSGWTLVSTCQAVGP